MSWSLNFCFEAVHLARAKLAIEVALLIYCSLMIKEPGSSELDTSRISTSLLICLGETRSNSCYRLFGVCSKSVYSLLKLHLGYDYSDYEAAYRKENIATEASEV